MIQIITINKKHLKVNYIFNAKISIKILEFNPIFVKNKSQIFREKNLKKRKILSSGKKGI
jgi:hypothetical protein